MLNCFIGHDNRLIIQTNVCAHSIAERASKPVAITPLRLETLPITRKGLTSFSFARFLVPWLMDFKGWALFLDGDIVVNMDVAELFALADPAYAIQVAGVTPEFERAAVMLMNCEHPDNRILTPEFVQTTTQHLHLLAWTDNVGFLPLNSNYCIGYARKQPLERIGILHYTMGVPIWPETADCEHADVWHAMRRRMCSVGVSWPDLMAASVHAARDHSGNPVPKYRVASDAIHEQDRSQVVDQKLD